MPPLVNCNCHRLRLLHKQWPQQPPTFFLDKDGQPLTKRLFVGANRLSKEGCPSLSGNLVTLPVATVEGFGEPSQHPTRKQLMAQFKVGKSVIDKWEKSGELAEKGWEHIPDTGIGTSPLNPRRYRPIPI